LGLPRRPMIEGGRPTGGRAATRTRCGGDSRSRHHEAAPPGWRPGGVVVGSAGSEGCDPAPSGAVTSPGGPLDHRATALHAGTHRPSANATEGVTAQPGAIGASLHPELVGVRRRRVVPVGVVTAVHLERGPGPAIGAVAPEGHYRHARIIPLRNGTMAWYAYRRPDPLDARPGFRFSGPRRSCPTWWLEPSRVPRSWSGPRPANRSG
jgi:hypothetical protein